MKNNLNHAITIHKNRRDQNSKKVTSFVISYSILIIPLLAVFLLVMSFSNIVTASDTSQPTKEKYFKAIEIEDGDTLWSIAQEYMTEEWASTEDYVKEIKLLNSLTTDAIHTGSYISIPYYLSE